MIDKQTLVADFLADKIQQTKVGLLVKSISNIDPLAVVKATAEKSGVKILASIVGYSAKESETEQYTVSTHVEKAVLWRSVPDCAGRIVVFIKGDVDKLHSLAEFDTITVRDITKFLIENQLSPDTNAPTQSFWRALRDLSDHYSFDIIVEFIQAVSEADDKAKAIPDNMWRLNLLKDTDILSTKYESGDRLRRNEELLFAIGQLSEDSRKKLSRSLARTTDENKKRLHEAYAALQGLYKYGNKENLKQLDFKTVEELFSASKATKKPKQPNNGDDPAANDDPTESTPIKNKELGKIIADAIISEDKGIEEVKELLSQLKKHFDTETEENDTSIPTIGGVFEDRPIALENHHSDLRKLVGKVCNIDCWGGLLETEESVLKDAISADIESFSAFNPVDAGSMTSFAGGVDGNQSLFNFIKQFDSHFDAKGLDTAEHFGPIIDKLISLRNQMVSNLDMIMYYPVLYFGADQTARSVLVEYIDTWAVLYHALSINEPAMREISAGGTSFIARAILLLDVLYVRTPKEWKGILLPIHPIFLWRYYEVFRSLSNQRDELTEDEKKALTEVLNQLPQVMSFLVANRIVTNDAEDKVLPCSGNIEMLPTFENKTNRYLGDDGTQSIHEVLSRWIGFAPYTKNEVRICSVDAPDLIGTLRSIRNFMEKNNVRRVVYDVYLTRKQNGNTELSKLDYSGKDYEIGEYIKTGRLAISVRNVSSPVDVKSHLETRPVHVAFYFDQSSYTIEYGPSNKNLYINPLVITYEYDYDEIQHKGSIFPSSEMDSGLIGDYHKLMKSADIISNNMNPRTTYNGNADMTAVVSTLKDGYTQWLVAADRDTNNYDPQESIPIGEMQFDKRVVNVWTSANSRIITQYLTMLRNYNLYPRPEALTKLLRRFGHIASNGLISIPRSGADSQAIDNKKKGLLGTLFAASWYTTVYDDALVASLDDHRARLWLYDSRYGNERADLVGLRYEEASNTLHIQPIEVKTRDESPDATISKEESTGKYSITGHAPGQIAAVVSMLHDIFAPADTSPDMFVAARREVLKYQIVSECFRSVHNSDWQKRWHSILKKAFSNTNTNTLNIDVSGLLVHVKLNETSGGTEQMCYNPEFDDCPIEYRVLTAKEIQEQVLGEGTQLFTPVVPDFDETENSGNDNVEDAVVDSDMPDSPDTEQSIKDEDNGNSINSESIQDSQATTLNESQANPLPTTTTPTVAEDPTVTVTKEEIEQLVRDFKRSCGDYHINLKECNPDNAVIGPSVIRLTFKLGRGQSKQGLESHLEDIGREMKRSGVIIQDVRNSDELLLDVPRLKREKVLFSDVLKVMPHVDSPEQLFFPLGRTPNGKDIIEDLSQMPHMLVGGSTGSGKSVFLFTMLSSFLLTHPHKEDMQLILSSSKLEDFIHFEGLPHLYSGHIISDAEEATKVIKEVVFEESERRGKLLADARVANIVEYNKKNSEKLAPIVVVIDEFADLADQLESTKEKNAFYKPVQRIAQAGRSRGIHLVICTQRPEAKLVPSTTKAQLNGRVALRVNDGISSRMIIESGEAQYLQKHGDMIYKNGDTQERAQGYLIEIDELDHIVADVIDGKIN